MVSRRDVHDRLEDRLEGFVSDDLGDPHPDFAALRQADDRGSEERAGDPCELEQRRERLGELLERVRLRRRDAHEADRLATVPDGGVGGRDDAQLAEQPVVRVRRVPNPGLDPGPLRGALAKPPAACEWHPREWCREAIRPDERERDRRIHMREVRNAGGGDAGQPHDVMGDLGGARRGARKDVEVRERLRDLGTLSCLPVERSLGDALPRHVPLDGDVARYRTALVENRREDSLLMEQGPVLAPVRDVGYERPPVHEGRPHGGVERRSLGPALEDARVLAHDLVAGVPADALEGWVHVLDRTARVGDDDRVGGLLDGRREPA